MKKILFPYERDVKHENAFAYAAKIARQSNAELIILHTFTFEVDDGITEAKYKARMEEKWQELMDDVRGLKGFYLTEYASKEGDFDLRIRYKILFGCLKTELFNFLKDEDIDLVVFTLLYEKREDSELTGSLLKSLSGSSKVPVLVVPEHHKFIPIQKIVYTMDFNQMKDSMLPLNMVKSLATQFDAELHFLYVSKNGSTSEIQDMKSYEYVKRQVAMNKQHVFKNVQGGNILKAVSNYVENKDIDLIVVVKQDRSFLESMFHESFTNQISFYSKEPILILHDGTVPEKESFKNVN